ncbi:MAG: putative protecting protein DprA [Proteobacteria bacterium]|nr:putative protecting protein DprA [Pseudomonadota bacterium]
MIQERSTGTLRYWLALHRAPGIGSRRGRLLVEHCGDPAAIFAEPAALSGLGLKPDTIEWFRRPPWSDVDRDLRWLESPQNHCLPLDHQSYPPLLREIPDPPLLLFVSGAPAALQYRQLAVVGSRNPSRQGEQVAHDFACALARANCAITSGLAIGIDAAAHRGALDGGGVTLAVAGTGLDQVYPMRHRQLAEAIIASGGALVSEFPTSTPPLTTNFPRRNRIISGLAVGTLVVEAALRSGSLITARMALEQGREVFAIPGSIQNPLARGCNVLIKQGAKLVESLEDIVEEFGWQHAPPRPEAAQGQADGPAAECLDLLKYIAYDPTSVDTLVAATGSTPDAISSMLLHLELQGYITSTSGGCFSRIK